MADPQFCWVSVDDGRQVPKTRVCARAERQSPARRKGTEADLLITFAGLAKHYLETDKSEHYETSKRNALAALEAIDHFKDRLPYSLRRRIETRRFELAETISSL